MPQYYCTVDAITVDFGDHGREYVRGETLDGVPDDAIQAMLRLNQASSDQPVDPFEESPESEPDSVEDWADVAVSKIGLSRKISSALKAAGLSTVREVLDYGAASGSLLDIPGIDEQTETAIQEAIAAIHQE